MDNRRKKVLVELDTKLWREIKVQAALSEKTAQQIVTEALKRYMEGIYDVKSK
jgi:hypothetical protein